MYTRLNKSLEVKESHPKAPNQNFCKTSVKTWLLSLLGHGSTHYTKFGSDWSEKEVVLAL